jgi:hypothetical protein
MELDERNIVLGFGRLVGHEEHFRHPVHWSAQHQQHILADLQRAKWQRERLRAGERYERAATRAHGLNLGESNLGRKRWIVHGNLVFDQRHIMYCFRQLVGC